MRAFFCDRGGGAEFLGFQICICQIQKCAIFASSGFILPDAHNSQVRLGILRVYFYAIHGGSSEFCDTMRINKGIFCPQKPVCVGFKLPFPRKQHDGKHLLRNGIFVFPHGISHSFAVCAGFVFSMPSIGKSSEILSFGRILRSPRNCRLTAPKTPA